MKYFRGLGFFINTIILYLIIPLLGWGITDIRGFFSSLPRLGYGVVICFTGLAIGFQSAFEPRGIHGSSGKKGKIIHRQRTIRITATLMLILGLAFLPYADCRNAAVMKDTATIRWIGLILFSVGMLFVVWSGISLGRFYSADVTIQEGHRLVTSGLYCYIRHPRYTGGILLGFGLTFLFRSWVGIIATVCFIGLILFRIQDEETVMSIEFEAEWERYCEKTWRLIPRIF